MRSIVVAVAILVSPVVARALAAQDIPANLNTVTAPLEQSQGNDDQIIYVDNRSSHTIIVTSVRLMECENVEGGCSTIRPKVRVVP